MAGFWIQTTTDASSWAVSPLHGDVVELAGAPPEPTAIAARTARRSSAPVVRRCSLAGNEAWILLIPVGMTIYVNGSAVKTYARLLCDRDSIWWRGISTLFFSTEREVRVEAFPGHGLPVYCPRCKLVIEEGQLAIECPACGLIHHEDPAVNLECWSYSHVCAGCERAFGSAALFAWTPHGI